MDSGMSAVVRREQAVKRRPATVVTIAAATVVAFAAAFLAAGCAPGEGPNQADASLGEAAASAPIDLRIGSPEAFGEPLVYGSLGLSTSNHDFDYRQPRHPRVRLLHGAYTLTTPEVEHIDIYGDKDLGGIDEIKLVLHEPLYGATHEQARDFVRDLIRQIRAAGWKRLIYVSSPRFKGDSALRTAFSDVYHLPPELTGLSLDPDAELPIADMVREGEGGAWSPRFRWQFYADGVELIVGLFDTRFDEKRPDYNTYRVELEFASQESQMRLLFPEKVRADWRELWPAKALELSAERAEREALARKHGLEIDESYSDPPIAPAMAGRRF